ncbi:uncharacterized protein LOC122500911 [Leptopilina heterotoma]|uniref:uncharacterized protein LOC122500911 n=1 Tax=Leptopilina heterotoma TaxID=63436 RepID=UPI001CA91F0A|nr:uncharacterized protein LOC122500911 [Leptopilina heterotoma]
MNETTSFSIHSAQTFQFLPLVNYISILTTLFYDQNLLESNERCQPFGIINGYFELLNSSRDQMETKRLLVQKLLEGSDLYGGNQNETLDMEYVNATFQFIISNIVFSDYGNIYGYLTKIVNSSNNLIYTFLKEEIFNDLKELKYINPDGSVTKLSLLSSVGIRDNFILPLFPEVDMNITDIDYIYAQAGLILSQSEQLINTTNLTFHDYVLIAQSLELTVSEVSENLTTRSALTVFTLPALLFDASKREKFTKEILVERMKNETFLTEVMENLFWYLNETFLAIKQKEYESSSFYKFNTSMSKYKNRTILAKGVLLDKCPPLNDSEYESAISSYKLFASSSKCPNNETISLPNIDELFKTQIDEIQDKYRIFMYELLEQVFYESKLVGVINSTKCTVYESQVVPIPINCFPGYCAPYQQRLKSNVYLFGLRESGQKFHYALVMNEKSIEILYYNRSKPEEFLNKVGLRKGAEIEISPVATILKRGTETFEVFLDRLSRMKARELKTRLTSEGYDMTKTEKLVEFLLALVPFYNCIRFSKEGNNVGATFSCIGDVLNWIPFGGQLIKLGGRFGEMALSQVIKAAGVSIRTLAARQSLYLSLKVGASSGLATMARSVITTKEMFKALSISFLRAVDPGFELLGLLGRLHWKVAQLLGKLFQKTWTTAARKFALTSLDSPKFRIICEKLMRRTEQSEMVPVTIGQMEGYEVFRYTYGEGSVGPKFVRLPNGKAELRRVIGFEVEKPVVVTRTKSGKVYYRKIDLKTGETYGLELKLNRKNVLQPVKAPFREHIATIVREGLSGRGRVILERRIAIVEAVNMMSRADPTASRQSLFSTMSHYVLAVEHPIQKSLNDIMLDPNLAMEIEDVNPYTIQNHLGNEPLTIDPNLNNYLITPTYQDFALDWIRTRKIHDVYKKYHIQHSLKLSRWRNMPVLDVITTSSLGTANSRLISAFGENYQQMVTSDLSTILHNYNQYNVRDLVNFVDYFSLIVYEQKGFTPELSNTINNFMNDALYKVAVRQTDEELLDFPRKLYSMELSYIDEINDNILAWRNNPLVTDSFLRASSDEDFLDNLGSTLSPGSSQVLVKYEIDVDSPYLSVFLNRFIPAVDKSIIIIPNLFFKVDEVIKVRDIILIKIHNYPITKEELLVKIMKSVKVRKY